MAYTPERIDNVVKCIGSMLHNITTGSEGLVQVQPSSVDPKDRLARSASRGQSRSVVRACQARETFKIYFVNNGSMYITCYRMLNVVYLLNNTKKKKSLTI